MNGHGFLVNLVCVFNVFVKMIWDLLTAVFLATSVTIAAVLKEEINLCSPSEFPCDGSRCVGLEHFCDGISDCADGFDEGVCIPGANASMAIGDVFRGKRQSGCRRNQWQCANGNCISFDGTCDGVVDCTDGSDETHPLCRKTPCQDNLFRCTYGACVDSNVACNGIQECADNSDELLPRCSNVSRTVRGKFNCDSGEQIPVTDLCDGEQNCQDGSDEDIRACAGKTCASYLFQCAYGACVDQGSDCDGKQDCADNSDESDELCNRTSTQPRPTITTTTTRRPTTGACLLPPYPEHGRYEVQGDAFAGPGDRLNNVYIKVTCEQGYGVDGVDNAVCLQGVGFESIPQCTRYCILQEHHSVEYTCLTQSGDSETSRPCGTKEYSRVFPGTIVIPRCRTPNYRGTVSNMRCNPGGVWDHIATCTPECGRITPEGKEYIINGTRAKHGELPWHAGIYRKTSVPYSQICGGSLVNTRTVISAAHCFWTDSEGKRSATLYAVALGKVYRPWNDTHDGDAQFSDVRDIQIPRMFRGAAINFQHDIAVVVLETEIVYQTFIRPVCVSFDPGFNERQLQEGKLGKIAGWGLTAANGSPSQVLLVVELPFVSFDTCYNEAPVDFREYITSDKFCAGFIKSGTALCEGDSGGGLAFPEYDQGIQRYYLRGIVSTAPSNTQRCDPDVRTTFTAIISHEGFLKNYVAF